MPLIVDNTVATPYLSGRSSRAPTSSCTRRPSTSAGTAPRSAASSSTAATSTWRANAERFPASTTADPSYHGLVYAGPRRRRPGRLAFIVKARVQLLRDLGPAVVAVQRLPDRPGPGDAVACASSGTSPTRSRSPSGWRRATRCVGRLRRACRRSPWYERGQKYAPQGAGAVLAFEIKGGVEAGQAFVDALELHSHVANIGDVRSLVIHPASTTHSQLSRRGAARHRRHARAGPARGRASSTSTTSWPTSRPASAPPRAS